MKISFGGIPGAGKTTVAKLLAKKLGYKYYYMGDIMRKMAEEKGLGIEEFYTTFDDGTIDRMVDEYQAKLGKEEDNFVIEGRTSFHFIPDSFKIYFDVDIKTAAERIFNDDVRKNEKRCNSVEDTLQSIKRRLETEKERFPKLYGFDCHDKGHYDFVVNTTKLSIANTLNRIVNQLKMKKLL